MPKRNAFGQIVLHPYIRFFTDDNGGGGGGAGGNEFTPPATQEDLDKIINGAVARTHKQYEGHDDLKAKAARWEEHEAAEAAKNKPKTDETPSGVSEEDVDKRINDALAAKDLELAIERVSDRLDKALDGRVFSASKLFSLDRKQFVKEDGKTVDADAISEWVEKNSTESEAPKSRNRIRGQGERDANATGGSVQAGRDLFDSEKKPQRKD